MIKSHKVGVWNKTPSTKIEGITIPGVLTWVKDIYVDIQPYSKALLLKEYGMDIEVIKRVYIDYFDSNIKIGSVFRYIDGYGKVVDLLVKAIPWDDQFMEVMCI